MLFAELCWNPGVSEIFCKKLCCLLNSIGIRGWAKYSAKNYAVCWILLEPGGERNNLQKTMLFTEFYWNPGVSEIFYKKLCCVLNSIGTRGWAKYSAKNYAVCWILLEPGGERNILQKNHAVYWTLLEPGGERNILQKTMLFAEFYWNPGVSEIFCKNYAVCWILLDPGGERNILQKLCC